MNKFSLKQLRLWFKHYDSPEDVPTPVKKAIKPEFVPVGEHCGIPVWHKPRIERNKYKPHQGAQEIARRQRQA